MKIVVVGLGYVGLSNAVLLAQNTEVIGVDVLQVQPHHVSKDRVRRLITEAFQKSPMPAHMAELRIVSNRYKLALKPFSKIIATFRPTSISRGTRDRCLA